MARRTKAEAEATRTALLDAAEHIFMEQGVGGATLEEVARRAGVTRGAIYWHFRNKVDLFNAVVDRVRLPLSDLVAALQQDEEEPIALLRGAVALQLRRLATDARCRRVYTILYHRLELTEELAAAKLALNAELVRSTHQLLCELFERAEHRGLLRPGASPSVAAISVRLFISGLHHDWLREPDRYDIELWGLRALDCILEGVVANPLDAGAPPAANEEYP